MTRADRTNAALQRAIERAAADTHRTFNEAVSAAMLLLKDTPVTKCSQMGRPFYIELRRAADLIALDQAPDDLLCIVEIEWSDEARGRVVTSWAPGYGPPAAEA